MERENCWRQKMIIQTVVDNVNLIKQYLKVAKDQQKKQTDIQYRLVEFQIGESVFLKIFPIREAVHLASYEKLSMRFISLFKIMERVGQVFYLLALTSSKEGLHNIFHVAQLKGMSVMRLAFWITQSLRQDQIFFTQSNQWPSFITQRRPHRIE